MVRSIPAAQQRETRGPIVSRASIPLALDAVTACRVTVQGRDEAEQTAVRAVSEHVTASFHRVAGAHVLARDAVAEDSRRRRGFESPDRRAASFVLDVEIDDRVRGNEDDLL